MITSFNQIPYGVTLLKSETDEVLFGYLYLQGPKKHDNAYRELVQAYGVKELSYDPEKRKMHIQIGSSVLEDLLSEDFVKKYESDL
ncbi:MAG: hypothetical protein PHX15_00185 [Candidatus Nanoarchaeia archaeon]|jgi:hypothetical protein|nr:hypothetical protein [Candidatus Nanoarchaeia archaeon]MDD4563411.1 hypothetical protein [Candidatus Nanoarchaeia archaeon]